MGSGSADPAALLARLRAESPGVRLRVQLIEVDRLPDALDADEVDIVIVGVPVPGERNWSTDPADGDHAVRSFA